MQMNLPKFSFYEDKWSEDRPKLYIDWFYSNGLSGEYLDKRNRYRKRVGMSKILDEGSFCFIKFGFFNYVFQIDLDVRKARFEE
jgi:hypothetical protein